MHKNFKDETRAYEFCKCQYLIRRCARLICVSTEGVMVAKKDFYSVWTYKSKDGENDVQLPNLEVINLLKSLKSRGYVKETFNW